MSIKQLAQQLGLSKSTVSRALNGYADVSPTTRAKVLQKANEIGYRPNATAKRLASGRSGHVGIILPASSHIFISPAFSKVLAGASSVLAKHDYQLVTTTVAPFQNEMKVYESFINSGLVDGLFVVRTRINDNRIRLLDERKFPYICHGYLEGFTNEQFVDVDNEKAFYDMTNRQISLGHRHIAFLDGPSEYTLSQARYRGYKKAMAESNLPIHPNWVLNGELSEEQAIKLAKEVLSLAQRPTSILCADDNMALGTIAACSKLGFSPGKDISVCGYGNYELSRYSKPSITSMKYETEKVGEEMAKLILNKLEKTTYSINNWYKATIVPRHSDGIYKA